MRVKNITQPFAAFVQELQESFWGDFRAQTRQRLRELLEKDAEQQMAEYLGLKWHERAKAQEREDYRNGFYERDYMTALGVIRLRVPRTRLRSSAALHPTLGAALAGSGRTDPAGVFARDCDASSGGG